METFGRYIQDESGEILSELSWLVLCENENSKLMITEKIIDYLPLKNNDSDAYNCDLQDWLNITFFNLSFTDDEKDMFKTYNGKKVFLLGIEDYEIYYDILSDQKTEFTDFAKTSATKSNKTKCEWWLKPNDAEIEYGCIVKENGLWKLTENINECCGVRPAVLVTTY